ncbi:stearoyl-CoA desaturase 5-like isoform X1 [Lytechinus pictus]|uniref:stearoyl-CoA desaturase 5-like isoform X1 n=2 Tax=Lytechinus pictus TaxID=7653 RepID=UPI0030B9CD0A
MTRFIIPPNLKQLPKQVIEYSTTMAPKNPVMNVAVSPEDTPLDDLDHTPYPSGYQQEQKRPPSKIVWRNVVLMCLLHLVSVYALLFTIWKCKMYTIAWTVFLYFLTGLGITAGAHRLWAHRSYKAKLPLRTFLGMCQTMAFQNDIFDWARDHRVHHKFSETDADPHNALRGFFFAHVGWLLVKKHPDVFEYGKKIDFSDLLADPVVKFQRRFYLPLVILFCFIIPTYVPTYWGESALNAYLVCGLLRYCLNLNATWLVNSAAHMWGQHPYDYTIHPAENPIVTTLALGEGWHNYHHVFPNDYRTGEFGWRINPTSIFIDVMAWFGQVTDRKLIAPNIIEARKQRTGEKVQHSD